MPEIGRKVMNCVEKRPEEDRESCSAGLASRLVFFLSPRSFISSPWIFSEVVFWRERGSAERVVKQGANALERIVPCSPGVVPFSFILYPRSFFTSRYDECGGQTDTATDDQ